MEKLKERALNALINVEPAIAEAVLSYAIDLELKLITKEKELDQVINDCINGCPVVRNHVRALDKTEAERVEVFDWIVMCDSGEVVMSFEESRDGVESMYRYLRDHNMIREAE